MDWNRRPMLAAWKENPLDYEMPALVKFAQFSVKESSTVTTPNFSSSAASLKQWDFRPSLWRNPFISTKTHTLNGEPII